MRILSFRSRQEGLVLTLQRPLHGLIARERRTFAEFDVPFRRVGEDVGIDFSLVEAALPSRMGRYDLLAVAPDGTTETLDFPDSHRELPIWRMYFRPPGLPTPLLPHLYINRSGSLTTVIRNPCYVDDEEREFRSRREVTSIRMKRHQLLGSFRLLLEEDGDYEIERCYLKLQSNEEIVAIDDPSFAQRRRGRRIDGHFTLDVPADCHLPPLRYALYVSVRDHDSGESIELKLNHVSRAAFRSMRRLTRPPSLPILGDRVLTLGSPPTASLISFIVRRSTPYDEQAYRQFLFGHLARLEARARRVARRPLPATALIFEKDAATAQDNGFALFDHLSANPDQAEFDFVYVMDRRSSQWSRVADHDRVVPKFSWAYWRLLVSPSSFLVSSDVRFHVANTYSQPGLAGKYAFLRKNYFLQHGVIGLKQVKILTPGSASFPEAIVASADWEKQIMVEAGVPVSSVDVVGLARWDRLVTDSDADDTPTRKKILYMPTWREWLEGRTAEELQDSAYARTIGRLLTSPALHELLEHHDVELAFLAHPKFPHLASLFENSGDRVAVLNQDDIDFAEVIDESFAVISDYSSIIWDFVQARRPALLYQFDLDQYQRLTGMYRNDDLEEILGGFPTALTQDDFLQNLQLLLESDPAERATAAARLADTAFPFHNEDNCLRTVEQLNRRLPDLMGFRLMPHYEDADHA